MRLSSQSQGSINVFSEKRKPLTLKPLVTSPKGTADFFNTRESYNPMPNVFNSTGCLTKKHSFNMTQSDMLGYMSKKLSLHQLEKEK